MQSCGWGCVEARLAHTLCVHNGRPPLSSFLSVRAETVHSLVLAEVERSAAEEGGSQGDFALEQGEQEEEGLASKMEVDQDTERCM